YALASWDPQTRQLTLLRDEFGIKPLYYSYQPERGLLAFASEPLALAEARTLLGEIEAQHLAGQQQTDLLEQGLAFQRHAGGD
ncbi:hypothetical protein IGA79_30900, partial [Pseudomonas aeruginosa]